MAYSKVIGAVGVVYHAFAVYCRTVVGDFLQLTDFYCTSRYSPRHSQFLVLLPRLWGNGQEFSLSDGDGDIKGAVDNFEDDGWVLNGGGVSVLQTRGVSGGSILMVAVGIFLAAVVVMTGVLTVIQETGALGPVALDWFSLAAPAWSGCLRILSGAFPFLIGSISTPSKCTCFFFFCSRACWAS
jgi:hypothetical protein